MLSESAGGGGLFRGRPWPKVAGSEGLLSSVRVTEGNHIIYLTLFVLTKDACIFDFSLVSPKPISEKESSDFVNFVQSFTYGKN